MVNAEQMSKLQKGDRVWFRTCYNEMNEGIVIGVSYSGTAPLSWTYARVEPVGKPGTQPIVRPDDIFLTKEDLIEANRDKWFAEDTHAESEDHAFRVEKYMKEVYTIRQLAEMYRDFMAIKEVLGKKSEELLDTPELFGHLY